MIYSVKLKNKGLLVFSNREKMLFFVDSVEDGEKVVKTAIDNFGRIGKSMDVMANHTHMIMIFIF